MLNPKHFKASPWDESVFNMPCYEITEPNAQALRTSSNHSGHYTVKMDPLENKTLLHQFGFYYTDTLIEPYCKQDHFISHLHPDVSITTDCALSELLPMCDNSFLHGRFHRDFNLPKTQADQRYKQWLGQLHAKQQVFALYYSGQLAGFIAYEKGNLLLHVVDTRFRGQGLAKYMWSAAIEKLFKQGEQEIRSSISAANLAVLNLYASLGFRFDRAQDIYHKLT